VSTIGSPSSHFVQDETIAGQGLAMTQQEKIRVDTSTRKEKFNVAVIARTSEDAQNAEGGFLGIFDVRR
jgi:hypothetical protein